MERVYAQKVGRRHLMACHTSRLLRKDQHETLLAKWLWHFPCESDSLWHKVTVRKYIPFLMSGPLSGVLKDTHKFLERYLCGFPFFSQFIQCIVSDWVMGWIFIFGWTSGWGIDPSALCFLNYSTYLLWGIIEWLLFSLLLGAHDFFLLGSIGNDRRCSHFILDRGVFALPWEKLFPLDATLFSLLWS